MVGNVRAFQVWSSATVAVIARNPQRTGQSSRHPMASGVQNAYGRQRPSQANWLMKSGTLNRITDPIEFTYQLVAGPPVIDFIISGPVQNGKYPTTHASITMPNDCAMRALPVSRRCLPSPRVSQKRSHK